MKKRLTIGLIAGATVFAAVFAMAASLGVTSDDVAAGDSVVAACQPDTTDVNISYTTAFQNSEYEVTEIEVTGIDAACDGQDIGVTLTDGGVALTSEDGTLADPGDGTHTFVLASPQGAEEVDGVHVVISG